MNKVQYICHLPTKLWEGNVFTPVCHSSQGRDLHEYDPLSRQAEPLIGRQTHLVGRFPSRQTNWTDI